MTARRRTPLDPYPEARPREESGSERAYPPELGPDAIAILEGRTFMFSDSLGDVPAGSIGGLLHNDTRFISTWVLTLNGRPLSLLKSRAVDYYSAAFVLSNPGFPDIRANGLAAQRFRFVGGGLHERITFDNALQEPVRFTLRLAVAADFADLFEVRTSLRDRSPRITVSHDAAQCRLTFSYRNQGFEAETRVHSSQPARIEGDDFVWDVELGHRERWETTLRVTVRVDDETMEPMHAEFGEPQEHAEGALTRWLQGVPRFDSDSALLKSVFDTSVIDMAALRILGELNGQEFVLPAAGLPWFMTLFGRDMLITSLQTLWVGPQLAQGALEVLGALQGAHEDDFRDEEPGKILHEYRSGELTVLGEKPYSPYYGTADATPLWLVLMSEYWRYSADDDFVRSRWGQVAAALEWIDRYGDRDGDGYVEYQTKSSQGLGNQSWKDSWDGVQFSDGRIPYLPIAAAEVQGYVYDAKLRVAEMADRLMGNIELGARLRAEAGELFERFNEDHWSEARGGYYVIGLDADKKRIDSMTSNMGHLLWSGIVPKDRAAIVAKQLMSPDLFSGWGVRTMSRADAGFNPIGYHTGTVWPHDNSIIALGLARYGFRDEANRVALAQLEAASFSNFRLPEAFAGFERDLGRFPVPYPTACSLQAWASGAPFMFIKAMLGLDARDGHVTLEPNIPEEIGRVYVHGMHAFGAHWDVEAIGTNGHVRLTR